MSESAHSRPRIVVGVDGSEHCKLALRWAARIARAEGARIDVVAAWDFPTYVAFSGLVIQGSTPEHDLEKVLSGWVDEAFGAERPDGLEMHTVRGGAASVLIDASADALMLVVGSRGHGGFAGLLLGSVSAKVAEHAKCPVLIVHEPKPGKE
jgi:nucleotide-binding universal stress UspA family protein